MRRLLAPVVCVGLLLGLAAPAFASGRVPHGVKRVSVTLTANPTGAVAGPAQHRTITKAASVATIVNATDALQTTKIHGACPMIMRLGPDLTIIYRNATGAAVAELTVQVVDGTKGDSGSSACFPIRFVSGGQGQSLVGNGFIRMMGRMLGTAIS